MPAKNKATLRRIARVLIVDDHPLVRDGLAARIAPEPDLEVCGSADSVDSALQQVKLLAPDVVIVDIALANSNGLDLIEQLHVGHPCVAMLVVSAYDELLYAERSLRAGAHGYISKREVQDDVITALRVVLRGERYLSAKMSQRMLSRLVHQNDPAEQDPVARLSNRELEVFQMIGEGKTTGGIAAALHLSVHTIDTHREKIRNKLGLKNGSELIQRAVQWYLENK